MLNKNFFLGCAIAALSACGGDPLDLGPENPNFGEDPPPVVEEPVVEKTYVWDFAGPDAADQVDDWRTGADLAVVGDGAGVGNDCDLETEISLHYQSPALQVKPTAGGWTEDFQDMCAMGFLSEPRAMNGGKIELSMFIPSFFTDQNPWNVDADNDGAGPEDDRYNFGLQILLEDESGNRAEAAGWINVYDLLGSEFSTAGYGYQQREPDPATGTVNGRWFDMAFNGASYSNGDDGFDIGAVVGVGFRLTIRDTNTALPWLPNEQYVFVTNVVMEPDPNYIPPAPTNAAPAFLSYEVYTDGAFESGFGEIDFSTGGEFTLRESIEAIFSGTGGNLQITAPDPAVDVSEFGSFRFSIFGPLGSDTASFDVSLCDCNDASVTVDVVGGQWNHFTIDISEFSDISMGAIKFVYNGVEPLTYYFDDIGFMEVILPPAGAEGGVHPVTNPGLVFFDFNVDGEDDDGLDKRAWWGNVGNGDPNNGPIPENDPAVSLDGTSYGRANFQTGGTGWQDLFWRNDPATLYGANVVAASPADFVLKFDINVFSPIDAGMFRIRFHDNDGVDAFYDWAPWTDSGTPFSTDGWETIIIPLADLGVPDFALVDNEFGMAFEGADILLDFAIDNVRFDYPGSQALTEVRDQNTVFFDFNADGEDDDGLDKRAWWGNLGNGDPNNGPIPENDPAVSLDGTSYGRANFQTGGTGWQDLFWRNDPATFYGADVVADNLTDYTLKFDINVFSPIDAGMFRIRFHDNDGVDAFYNWAPWGTDNPYQTNGWVTVSIPATALGVPDMSLVDNEFGMAFEGADILLDFAIDNVRFESDSPVDPVDDPALVFYDFNADGEDDDGLDKRAWWGNVGNGDPNNGPIPENDPAVSLDGTSYGRANFQTGGTGWQDLFWRNDPATFYGADVVADNALDYTFKFDINVFSPIDAGMFRIRFHDNDGVDAFYNWAPWTDSGEPYSTDGWVTVSIPVTELGVPDFSLVDNEFGMAFEGADILLDFAIDNVRFEEN